MLRPIIAEAINRWSAAGIGADQLSTLSHIDYRITDLDGSYLGLAGQGVILIDTNAAGYGWFVDATSADDSEFAPGTLNRSVKGHVDLLSVVSHELGHELGFVHDDGNDVMSEALKAGVRHVPLPRA